MPRPLVYGNGSLLIGLDRHYVIRDLFYPQVGRFNHLSGHALRMGVWVDGRFSWVEDPGWIRDLRYEPETLLGEIRLINLDINLQLEIREGVSHRADDFLRRIRVTNLKNESVEVRFFFAHDLRIMETDIGDTAFYNPFLKGVVHYKGPCYFLFGGRTDTGEVDQYATGIKGFGGLEGTWRDAEDGHLSMNPIAQGSVDSTIGMTLKLGPKATGEAAYWIFCGTSLEDLETNLRMANRSRLDLQLDEIAQYWRAWSAKASEKLTRLPDDIAQFALRSLLLMRTQIDSGGAILAANDSDIMETNRATYSYMWPRDGALVSSVFDRIGFPQVPRRFLKFCQGLLTPARPFLLQKYGPDGTVGASWHPWVIDGDPEIPFQEDETALTLWALGEHYRIQGDLEFIGELFDRMIRPMADFLVLHRYDDGLPKPSYDLWEERRGVHTHTVGAVVAGLKAAAVLSEALGESEAVEYRTAARQTAQALKDRLFDSERGVFYRRLAVNPDGSLHPDSTIDASTMTVPLVGALPIHDPAVAANLRTVEATLWVGSKVGGMARYQDDYYFRASYDVPGNPWVICTMWLAQSLLKRDPADRVRPEALLRWVMARAEASGVLSEQVHPLTGAPLSVSPLTWSHAEFVTTALDYADVLP